MRHSEILHYRLHTVASCNDKLGTVASCNDKLLLIVGYYKEVYYAGLVAEVYPSSQLLYKVLEKAERIADNSHLITSMAKEATGKGLYTLFLSQYYTLLSLYYHYIITILHYIITILHYIITILPLYYTNYLLHCGSVVDN